MQSPSGSIVLARRPPPAGCWTAARRGSDLAMLDCGDSRKLAYVYTISLCVIPVRAKTILGQEVDVASIFLSYRRSDSVAWAKLLRDSITKNLPQVQVFRDIDAILPGDNFVQVITDAVGSCDVLIALIGPTWRSATNVATGKPRLFESKDYTRLEIATALSRGVRVIPVLVGGATMPVSDELPEDLQALCERHNIELSDRTWDDACRHLADVLARILAPQGGAPLPLHPQQTKPETRPHAVVQAEEGDRRANVDAREGLKRLISRSFTIVVIAAVITFLVWMFNQ